MGYDWTKVKFWKKPDLSKGTYQTLTLLGFTGLDHFYLRSPLTGLLKLVVSFFILSSLAGVTAGGSVVTVLTSVAALFIFSFWWLYDIATAFTEWDLVKQYGIQIPLTSKAGIGAGMFMDDNAIPDPNNKNTPSTFIKYVLASLLPIGLNNWVAGDSGGFIKTLVLCMTIIGLIPALMFMIRNWFVILFDTQSIFTQGIPQFFGRVPSDLSLAGNNDAGILRTLLSLLRILEVLPVIGPLIGIGLNMFDKIIEIIERIMGTVKTTVHTAGTVSTMAKTVPYSVSHSRGKIEERIKKEKIHTVPISSGAYPGPSGKVFPDGPDMPGAHQHSIEPTFPALGVPGMPPMQLGMPSIQPSAPPMAPGVPMPLIQPSAPPMPADKTHSLLSSMASDRKLAINPIQIAKQHGGAFIGDDTGISGTVFLSVLYGGLLLAIGNFMYKQYKKVKEDREQLEKPKDEHDDIPPPE